MPDVRMPDGTIMRNVPANATKAQILAAHAKAREAGAVPDNRPKSFWQGIAEGIHTPANNTIRAVDNINPFMIAYDKLMGALGHNQPSHADVIDKAYHNARAKSGYQGGTGGTIVGNIAGTLPALIFGGGPMTQGAIQGAMLTKNRDAGGIAADAGIGVVDGKIGDVVGRRVIAPVVNAALRTKAGQAVSATAKAALAKVPSVSTLLTAAPRLNAPEKTVTRMSPDIQRVTANLQDAQRLGLPYALADASPKTRALAGSVSRKSLDARQLAEDTFVDRSREQAERAIKAVKTHLAQPVDVEARANGLQDAANAISGPHYEKSFQGGSMAPLEDQLTQAFNQSSKSVSDAAQELAAAQRAATLTKAGVSRAGDNVYMNASALPADRQAAAAIAAAEQKLANAKAGHEQVLSVLRKSQDDAANNAPGAIWSPRIQSFLDDPIGKPGMASGLETQRLESLAAGKPFNPTEYAVTGYDEAGQPIIGNVPNMRTLDSYKKGLDRMIEDETNDFGRLSQRGRALVQVKNALVGELDAANPEYGLARGKYGDWMESRKALLNGQQAADRAVSAQDVASTLSGYTDGQANEFRNGFASRLVNDAEKGTDGSNPWTRIVGGIDRRGKIDAAFPEGAQDFNRIAQLEGDMSKTAYETTGGSPSQLRNMADQLFDSQAADVLSSAASPKTTLAKIALQKARDQVMTRGQKNAEKIAPVLFNTNPAEALAFINSLTQKQADIEAQRAAYGRLMGGIAIPGAVAFNQ